jgi:hypothetical protein
MASSYDGRRWALARGRERDPAKYLGKLRHIPAAVERRPGEWCEIVVRDEHWALVVVDARTASRR